MPCHNPNPGTPSGGPDINAAGFGSDSLYSIAECRFGDIVDRSYASAGKFLGRADSLDGKDDPRFFGLC
jgi:hypothetical protein